MKSAVPVHKVLRLPRALQLKVLKVLRLPRNLQFQCAKRCSVLATKSALPVHKVLRLPRNLLLKMFKVLRVPRNLTAHTDSHRAALPRRFAVAGAALCESKFCF